MSIVLIRIDDRLIHGQVVEGWLRVVRADRIVVACDEAARDPLQVSLMKLAVPSGIHVSVLNLRDAGEGLRTRRWKADRILVLLPGVREACLLVESGVPVESINLGGQHDAPGRTSVTPFLFLSTEDRRGIASLLSRRISLEVRALPLDPPCRVEDFLDQRSTLKDQDVRPQ